MFALGDAYGIIDAPNDRVLRYMPTIFTTGVDTTIPVRSVYEGSREHGCYLTYVAAEYSWVLTIAEVIILRQQWWLVTAPGGFHTPHLLWLKPTQPTAAPWGTQSSQHTQDKTTRQDKMASMTTNQLSSVDVAQEPEPTTALENGHHPEPFLNLDILNCIMDLLHVGDLISTMSTCHVLHCAGAKLLLANPPILSDPGRLLGFCNLILTDESRSAILRRLTVKIPRCPIESSTISLLTQVLESAKLLATLTLHLNIAYIESHSSLISAIQHLPSLRSLDLGPAYGSFKTKDIITGLRSPLRELHVSLIGRQERPDAQDILRPLSESLEVLDLRGVTWTFEDDLQFSAIRRLTIQPLEANHNIGILVQLFPNLTHLDFAKDPLTSDTSYYEQACQRNIISRKTCRWSSLEYLGGGFMDIFVSMINCQVEHLDIRNIRANDPTVIPALLNHMRPRILTLDIRLYLPAKYWSIFRNASFVRDLRMTLQVYDQVPGWRCHDSLADNVLRMLAPLHIESLNLIWRTDVRLDRLLHEPDPVYFHLFYAIPFVQRIGNNIRTL
ncbi:hypothetical protein CERSUDRAFT_124506, partial [Gelatoporia subvermispora B]